MPSPTYDYEAEQAAIARQMKVAEAMQAQGMAPLGGTEMAGGIAVRRSPFEGAAKLLQAYLGGKHMEAADRSRKELGARYNADLKTGVADLIDGLGTQAGQSPAVADESGGHAGAPFDAAGAKRAAVLRAVASNHPTLQSLGTSYLNTLQKEQPKPVTVQDLLAHADPASIPGMISGGTGAFRPKEEKPIEVSGMLLHPKTLQVLKAQGEPPKQITIAGDLYEINPTTGQYKKLDNAPKITNNNNPSFSPMIAGPKAGVEEWSKLAARTVGELNEGARYAVKLESQLNQIEALTAAGTRAGPAAGLGQFVAGLAKQAGIPVDANKLNNSAALESVATQAWAALMQQNGGARGLVKEESEKLAQSLPSLIQTSEGRMQIIQTLRQAAAKDKENAWRASTEYSKAINSGKLEEFTFGLSSTMAPQTQPTGPAPGSVAPGKVTTSNWPGR